jgi:pantetheine-phosphate adenylyltransferase
MKKALFAGTFDPPTLGHLDLIRRAATLCEKLYVGIALNTSKDKPLLTVVQRKQLLEELTIRIPQVEVVIVEGMVIDFVQRQQVNLLIRGVRNFSDFDTELQMASANRKMGNIETLFLPASDEQSSISSHLIREIIALGGPLEQFLPAQVIQLIRLQKD